MTKTRHRFWRRAAMAAFLTTMVALLRVLAAPEIVFDPATQLLAVALTALACVSAAAVAVLGR